MGRFRPRKQILSLITGPGKSFLLKLFRDRINLVLNASGSQNVLVVTATTGVADRNIQGTTLHRAFLLPVEKGNLGTYRPLEGEPLNDFRHLYRNLKCIIID